MNIFCFVLLLTLYVNIKSNGGTSVDGWVLLNMRAGVKEFAWCGENQQNTFILTNNYIPYKIFSNGTAPINMNEILEKSAKDKAKDKREVIIYLFP